MHRNISPLLPDDLQTVMELFAACVADMKKQGSTQWNENYPDRTTVLHDLGNGHVYGLRKNGELQAIITINKSEAPTYEAVNWLNQNQPGGGYSPFGGTSAAKA